MWYRFPLNVPADEQVCWCRVNYYYGTPFLAIYNGAAETFTSVVNGITYPVYMVARWRPSEQVSIIKNGSFANENYWELFGNLYISSGKLWVPDQSQYDFRQVVTLLSGHNFTLKFTLGDLVGTSEISFTDDSFYALFGSTFPNGTTAYPGINSFNVTTDHGSSFFNVYLLPDSYPMSITDISLVPT